MPSLKDIESTGLKEGRKSWQRVIGIVGGLGPFAHIEFERRLLAAVENPSTDQDYPDWIVSSVPHTPDRTLALLEGGASPVPSLVRGIQRLGTAADFAVIACMTAHAFLDEVRPRVRLPLLDLVALTLSAAARRFGQGARIGILATTGSLMSGVYSRALRGEAAGLSLVSPLDLPAGARVQEDLVMRPIYGPLQGGRRLRGGIKSGGDTDPETGVSHRDTLTEAVRRLAAEGAVCAVTGCTEIPLVLGREQVDGIPLLDPMDLGAQTSVRIARGELPLP